MTPVAPGSRPGTSRAVLWTLGLVPLVLLGGLLALIASFGPGDEIRGDAPPVEMLAVQAVRLTPAGIELTVLNDGPDPVTVAQVMVDEAYWAFTMDPRGGSLRHLEHGAVRIPYPWVEGEAHELRLISSTGVTFDHSIELAVATPRPSGRFFAVFALIGLYVGVIPVALGLLWYPWVRRLGSQGLDFVLALTVGLLLFLLVDTLHEGIEAAEGLPASYQGMALLIFAAGTAYLAIEGFGHWLRRRRASGAQAATTIALLVAVGIGLHNFGEGLAIGAAFALGEVALGTLLILGFTLHNTTEGLAIVAPLAAERPGLSLLVLLGTIAGVPTIAGAWLGGFVYSPVWAVLFLGLGAGAIAQVVVQIVRSAARDRGVAAYLQATAVMAGLLLGVGIMYATGMLVG